MNQNYTALAKNVIALIPVTAQGLNEWLASESSARVSWVKACQFRADPGQFCYLPGETGELEAVLFAVKDAEDFWAAGGLPALLPEGTYAIANENNFYSDAQYQRALLAWGLGCYQFDAYVKRKPYQCQLHVGSQIETLQRMLESIYLVRDLINMPANKLGPSELEQAALKVANECGANFKVIKGEDLLTQNFPAIYAVGKGAEKAPRLLDLVWGKDSDPKVTLVGKGVCFDSGGLDLKPAANMLLMKKDMGGAAHVLGLARLIMQSKLPVRLRVLIPAVENSVDGKSYRPGDVIETRKGSSVEIGNTDAEGRLVLADALTEAVSESPEYLIDIATLTGAARVALGPEVAVMLSNEQHFAAAMLEASVKVKDPLWQLPLYQPYLDFMKTEIADISNMSRVPQGGAITAALFLQHFVPDTIKWMHFDINAYNVEAKPGRPLGGEAMAFRGIFQFLVDKFGSGL